MSAPNPMLVAAAAMARRTEEASPLRLARSVGPWSAPSLHSVAAEFKGDAPASTIEPGATFIHPNTGAHLTVGVFIERYSWTCERSGEQTFVSAYALEGKPTHHLTVCGCGETTYERHGRGKEYITDAEDTAAMMTATPEERLLLAIFGLREGERIAVALSDMRANGGAQRVTKADFHLRG